MPKPVRALPTLKKAHVKLAYRFALAGLSNVEIAEEFEVSIACLKSWMKANPPLAAAINRGRTRASTKVVGALFKRAIGYTETVVEDRILPNGAVVSVTNQRTEPGNVTAQIFWLKNRLRKHWYDESPRQPAPLVDAKDATKVVRDGIRAIKQLEALPYTDDDDSDSTADAASA